MAKLRVLIADDESIIRMDVREIVEAAGHAVVAEASNGKEAWESIQHLHPDVAVLDVKMPRLNGLTVAERIARTKLAPVVLLTAYHDRRLIQKAKKSGVFAYLVKPFKEKDLLTAIDLAIARFEEMRTLEHEVSTLKEGLESRKLLDRAKGYLMDRFKMSEDEAFRFIQRRSMDTRRRLIEVAQEICAQKDEAKKFVSARASKR